MIYRDLLIMRDNLDLINVINDVDPMFLYAVSRNKLKINEIIKSIDSIKKPSEKIEEFWRKVNEINMKYAEADESGNIQYINTQIEGQLRQAFKKIIGMENPNSDYSKEINNLKKEYQEEIDNYDQQIKNYNTMLEKEISKEDFHMFMIDLEIVPKGLHPKAMDGCFPFINEVKQEIKAI
jgi:phenylalanyl-tRNA synthetase alpha subunit